MPLVHATSHANGLAKRARIGHKRRMRVDIDHDLSAFIAAYAEQISREQGVKMPVKSLINHIIREYMGQHSHDLTVLSEKRPKSLILQGFPDFE